ncbi:hypothetical protein [Desulfurobacterium crinifex]
MDRYTNTYVPRGFKELNLIEMADKKLLRLYLILQLKIKEISNG